MANKKNTENKTRKTVTDEKLARRGKRAGKPASRLKQNDDVVDDIALNSDYQDDAVDASEDDTASVQSADNNVDAQENNLDVDVLSSLPEYNILPSHRPHKTSDDETFFDKSTLFMDKIRPHINRIKLLCETNGIPMYMTFCYSNTEMDGAAYYTDGFIPEANRIVIGDDRFVKHVNVDAGIL